MKSLIRQLAYRLLGAVAHQILLKYRPKVVAVSGSQGKTSTVEAIYLALSAGNFSVRRSFGNYNTEWGVPASIIGEEFIGSKKDGLLKVSLRGYLKILLRGLLLLVSKVPDYPRVLVLEMALDRPGDLSYLTKVAPPQVAVLTNVSESHLGFFGSRERLIQEKGKLIEGLLPQGLAVLNHDDPSTPLYRHLAKRKGAEVRSFGQGEGTDWQISEIKQTLEGLSCEVKSSLKGTFALSLPLLGRQFAFSAAAALAVADYFGCDLKEAVRNLSSFRPAPHRMNKLRLGSYLVIDDTYNASYDSFREALWALNQITGNRRRVAIIGGIHELGDFAPAIHRRLGKLLAEQVDQLIIIGPEAEWTREGALSGDMSEGKIEVLSPGEEDSALELLRTGDAVLFKASRTRELDKLVEKLKEQVSR